MVGSFRQAVVEHFPTGQPALYPIGSMPVETCHVARAPRIRICQENPDTAPDHGYCAAREQWYPGYKLHVACNPAGVVQTLGLPKASTHGTHYLDDVHGQFPNCVLAGDKGYPSGQWQADWFAGCHINLETLPRKDKPDISALPAGYHKARKRMETVFSQLCD